MTQLFFKNCRWLEPRGLNLNIDGWLRGIGLAQYAQIFRANDIDTDLLGPLTNDDLKDIGVASFAPSQEAARCDRGPRCYARSYLPDTRRRTGAEGSRHCRAPPSYGDVLGPRRFDGTLREHGPGGPTRT